MQMFPATTIKKVRMTDVGRSESVDTEAGPGCRRWSMMEAISF